MAFGVNRTPGLPARDRRNNDRLSDNDSIVVEGNAVQLNDEEQLVLVINTGEPLSQNSSGLALDLITNGGLEVVSGELGFEHKWYQQIDQNGFGIGDGTLEILTFAETASAVNHIQITNAATSNPPLIEAVGDDTNVDLVIKSKANGAILFNNDFPTTARGTLATELQREVAFSNQIASGNYSTICGGRRNSATGLYATVVGGQNNRANGQAGVSGGTSCFANGDNSISLGSGNDVSSSNSVALGSNNTISVNGSFAAGRNNTVSAADSAAINVDHTVAGSASVAFGRDADIQSTATTSAHFGRDGSLTSALTVHYGRQGLCNRFGSVTQSPGSFAGTDGTGDAQSVSMVGFVETSDNTPTVMTLDNGFIGTERAILPTDSVCNFFVRVVAAEEGHSDVARFDRSGLINNDGGTTALVGTVDTIGADKATAGAGTWTVGITADNTNDALTITVTGQAATNIRWVAHIGFVECKSP